MFDDDPHLARQVCMCESGTDHEDIHPAAWMQHSRAWHQHIISSRFIYLLRRPISADAGRTACVHQHNDVDFYRCESQPKKTIETITFCNTFNGYMGLMETIMGVYGDIAYWVLFFGCYVADENQQNTIK